MGRPARGKESRWGFVCWVGWCGGGGDGGTYLLGLLLGDRLSVGGLAVTRGQVLMEGAVYSGHEIILHALSETFRIAGKRQAVITPVAVHVTDAIFVDFRENRIIFCATDGAVEKTSAAEGIFGGSHGEQSYVGSCAERVVTIENGGCCVIR